VCCGEYMCTNTQLRSGDRGGYYRCKAKVVESAARAGVTCVLR
jgi:hypothetical protein